MIVEFVLGLAALSGDVNACDKHRQRLDGIAAALDRRPRDAMLYYFEAVTWADCGQTEPLLAALARTQEFGAGFLPVRSIGFDKVWNVPAFQERYTQFEHALPRVGADAPVVYTARGVDLIPEGIAHDERHQALYMGSIARGEIIRLRNGKQEVFADRRAGLTNVLGLAIDPRSNRLYAVNTSTLTEPDAPARNEVVAFDLETGAVAGRFNAAEAGQLNDVALSTTGILYVSDSAAGVVYRGQMAESGALEVLVKPGMFGGPNGLAVGDGALFVAHTTGIARVDVESGVVTPLTNETREAVGAIDGLYFERGVLFGIQNATNPGRVIRIELDPTRTKITGVRTLLSHHHPALNEPTTGAIAGDRLLVLANSYVATLDEQGKLRDRSVLRDPVVLAVGME